MKNLNSQGAGLGLTISNLIVKGLSGNGRGLNLVSNTDSDNHGSEFSFQISQ